MNSPIAWICRHVYRSERQWFWMREGLHFLGGEILGVVALSSAMFWKPAFFGVAGALIGIVIAKEVGEDRVSQPRVKTWIDCLSWTLGLSVVGAAGLSFR